MPTKIPNIEIFEQIIKALKFDMLVYFGNMAHEEISQGHMTLADARKQIHEFQKDISL